jgi:hypothetical protein
MVMALKRMFGVKGQQVKAGWKKSNNEELNECTLLWILYFDVLKDMIFRMYKLYGR